MNKLAKIAIYYGNLDLYMAIFVCVCLVYVFIVLHNGKDMNASCW